MPTEAAGRIAEAIALDEATPRAARGRSSAPDHPDTIDSRNNLAVGSTRGRPAGPSRAAQRSPSLARRRDTEKPDSPFLAGDLAALGDNLLEQAKWSEAEPVLRECLAIREKSSPTTGRGSTR